MDTNNQNNQDIIDVHKIYFKNNNLNKKCYILKKKDVNIKNDDKGFFFKKDENKYSIFMKSVTRNPLSSNNLNSSLSQNVLNFSTTKKNTKENFSNSKLLLPSIMNSNSIDDNSNINVVPRRIFKLKTERISESRMKLFQNKIQQVGSCDNIKKKPVNLDFLKDRTKYYELFFYNEKDYYKRLERAKRRKIEKQLKKKTNSVFNFNEYFNIQNDFLFQKNFQAERKL